MRTFIPHCTSDKQAYNIIQLLLMQTVYSNNWLQYTNVLTFIFLFRCTCISHF